MRWTRSRRSFAACRATPTEIRRLFWRDPEFRTICEDYRDCLDGEGRASSRRTRRIWSRPKSIEQLAAELLAEAAAMLKGDRS